MLEANKTCFLENYTEYVLIYMSSYIEHFRNLSKIHEYIQILDYYIYAVCLKQGKLIKSASSFYNCMCLCI